MEVVAPGETTAPTTETARTIAIREAVVGVPVVLTVTITGILISLVDSIYFHPLPIFRVGCPFKNPSIFLATKPNCV